MICFTNVVKKFGGIIALNDVSFTVEKGEFIFITGHSGAGKTTLMRLLTGEYLPTKGSIKIDDLEINKIPRRKIFSWRQKIGVVYQDYKLFPEKTVFENVAVPLEIQKTPSKEIKGKVDKILELVGLKERSGLFPAQLAGGELQRTSLARAVVTAPEILLADEPTGNLDPMTASEMIELFKEINNNGTTVLMATHNQEIVDSFNTRVVELQKGKIIRDEKEGKYKCMYVDSAEEKEAVKKTGKSKKV